jgi:hypothetical protein
MLKAAPDLLTKAPNELTCEIPMGRRVGAKGTGAYSMEARQLSHEHRFRDVPRGVLLLVALLLCLDVFLLPLPASGSEEPSALAMSNFLRVDQATNGTSYPLDEPYLVVLGEESEDAEKSPLKAELLTMLLLAVSFGATVGWLLTNAQRQGALRSLACVHPSLATACEDLPFLGVFRL